MSNGKLPPLKSITPSHVSSEHRIECPFGVPRRRTPPDAPCPMTPPELSTDCFVGSDVMNDAMQLAAPPGDKRGVLSKPDAEASWNGEARVSSSDLMAGMFRTTIDALTTETGSLRFTAALDLIGLARDHLAEGSPHVEEVFAAATWLMKASHKEQHLGDRNLSAKIMIHANHLLPRPYLAAHETAQLLRTIIQEQEDDVDLFMRAYRDLIHCFPDDHMEIGEGLVIFEGIATLGRSEEIRAAARDAYQQLTTIRDPSFYRQPKSSS